MECHYKNREKTITRYLTGELSEKKARRFEEHYYSCDACFQELRLQQHAIRLIKAEGDVLFNEYLENKSFPKENWLQSLFLARFRLPRFEVRLIKPAVVVLAILALVFSVYLYWNSSETDQNIIAKIEYSQKTPYEYHPDQILRGIPEKQKTAELEEYFFKQFQRYMLIYKDRDYKYAVQYLGNLKDVAQRLEASTKDKKSLTLVRDYYFYLGISQFAAARRPDSKLTNAVKQQYLEGAIESLSIANEMSENYQLKDNDKVTYFLGLSLGFAGNRELAVQRLKAIQTDDPAFKYRYQLINIWSSQ